MSDIPNVDQLGADGLPPSNVAPTTQSGSISGSQEVFTGTAPETSNVDQTAAESGSSLSVLAPQVGQPSMAGSGVDSESVSHGIANQNNTFLQSSLGSSTGVANSNAGNAGGAGTGGGNTTGSAATTNSDQASAQAAPSSQATVNDIRVRLAALYPNDVYATGIMAVLNTTGGMMFPYTPQISFSQSVNYMDLNLVHSNTDYPAYTRTPSVSISINGKFSVQNQAEGQYALACLHFLRTASKSYFGETDAATSKAGLPPPILVLSGYGNYMFNQLRVVLKSHNWSFDDSSDGIDIMIGSGRARLPSLFSIQLELMVVQTPQRMRQKFSFNAFASGALMSPGTPGWI